MSNHKIGKDSKEIKSCCHKPHTEMLVSEPPARTAVSTGVAFRKDRVPHPQHTQGFLLDLWLAHSLKSPPLLLSPPLRVASAQKDGYPQTLGLLPQGHFRYFLVEFKAMVRPGLGHWFCQCPCFRQDSFREAPVLCASLSVLANHWCQHNMSS